MDAGTKNCCMGRVRDKSFIRNMLIAVRLHKKRLQRTASPREGFDQLVQWPQAFAHLGAIQSHMLVSSLRLSPTWIGISHVPTRVQL